MSLNRVSEEEGKNGKCLGEMGFLTELPEYFVPYLSRFSEADATAPFCSEAEFAAAADALSAAGFDRDCLAFLREENAALARDSASLRAARFLRFVMIEQRNPWDNDIASNRRLMRVPGYEPESFELLLVVTALGYTLTTDRRPPEEMNGENLKSICNFTKKFYDARGFWGIQEWNWDFLCAGGCMFRFNTLNFQPKHFSKSFLVLTDGTEYVTLLRLPHRLTADGIVVEEDEAFEKLSHFEETEEAWIANVAAPTDGKVDLTPRRFEKSKWRVYLSEQDYVLNYHIPQNTEYTPEQHRISMMQAVEFYRRYYPTIEWKGFACSSWLYSPQNVDLFAPGSKITEMERYVHTCPTASRLSQKLMFLREGSSLHRKVCDYLDSGHVWRSGYIYVPLAEAETFGQKPIV